MPQAVQDALEIEQAMWEFAAESFQAATDWPVVIVPDKNCQCLGCEVARTYLLPFLPVTWH